MDTGLRFVVGGANFARFLEIMAKSYNIENYDTWY